MKKLTEEQERSRDYFERCVLGMIKSYEKESGFRVNEIIRTTTEIRIGENTIPHLTEDSIHFKLEEKPDPGIIKKKLEKWRKKLALSQKKVKEQAELLYKITGQR